MKAKRVIYKGWQCKVYVYDDFVIKVRKTLLQSWITILLNNPKRILKSFKDARRVQNDYDSSIEVLRSLKKFPYNLLGNPVFLKKDEIKQEKVLVLGEELKRLVRERKIQKAKKLIDNYFDLTLELWKYGIYDKVYNFTINNGISRKKLVLIDFLEIGRDLRKLKKDINNKVWTRRFSFKRDLPKELQKYFVREANRKLTLINLKKNWRAYLK